jgi:hypothetical protein
MAHVSGGDVYLDHSAQEVDDNIEEVVEARRGHTSLAQAIAEAAEPYVLPKASASELGGVKVGEGLSIEDDGTLKVVGGGSYSETELLAAPIVGDSASSISPISLLDSIDNYDQLVFRFGVLIGGSEEQCCSQSILCSDLKDNVILFLCFYPNTTYNLYYGISKNTDMSFITVNYVTKNGWAETATIFSIKGIKYTSDAS